MYAVDGSISFLVDPFEDEAPYSGGSRSVTSLFYLAAKAKTALGANVNAYQAKEPMPAKAIPTAKQATLQNSFDCDVGNTFHSNAPDQAPFAT